MRYQGGKHRIAKHLMRAIQLHLYNKGVRNLHELTFVEPFCGGANMTAVAAPYFKDVLAYDPNPYIVAMWACVASGWRPPFKVEESRYQTVLRNYRQCTDKYEMAEAGFILSGCSYGGIFAGAYAKDGPRDFAKESHDGVMKKAQTLESVKFMHSDYRTIHPPKGSIVYCDPPYAGTTGYKFGTFDPSQFWLWAQEQSKSCVVFVSEKHAPAHWKNIWQMPIQNALSKTNSMTERLFVLDATSAEA